MDTPLCWRGSSTVAQVSTIFSEDADPHPSPVGDAEGGTDPARGTLATEKAPAWKVLSWGMWDWGTQPFQTVITTFVFSVYLTSPAFGDKDSTSLSLSLANGIAGAFIALLAPVLGAALWPVVSVLLLAPQRRAA